MGVEGVIGRQLAEGDEGLGVCVCEGSSCVGAMDGDEGKEWVVLRLGGSLAGTSGGGRVQSRASSISGVRSGDTSSSSRGGASPIASIVITDGGGGEAGGIGGSGLRFFRTLSSLFTLFTNS